MTELPDYVVDNRVYWDQEAPKWVARGERAWSEEPSWGMWGVPETKLQLLPAEMTGLRAIELGCGTGYVSAWMVRRGASVVGIDNSREQLRTAERLAAEHGVDLELIHGIAEDVPFPDGSFDFAVSEYGAAIWADPYKWIPEAHRLLKPGGELSFLGHHPIAMIVRTRSEPAKTTRELLWPYFGMHRVDWLDESEPTTEFNLPISDWMRLFDEAGFDVVSFHEIRNADPRADERFEVDPVWAHDFPSEQAWRLRKH